MARNDNPSPTLRLTLVTLIVVGLFAALFSRLWFLQVLAGERYSQLAEENRVRFVVTEAPRGRILDRAGDPIVKNRPALTVSADKRRLLDGNGDPTGPEEEAVLERLSAILEMPVEEILERLNSRKYSPFRPVPVKIDVDPEDVFTIEERRELFPGVTTQTLPVRTYPYGTTAAHVLGYIGEINDEELDAEEFQNYWPGDLVGKSGLEASYEHYLQGKKGRRQLEVNAQNTVQRVLETVDPVRGADLVTTVDLNLQRHVENLLAEGLEASRDIARSDGRDIESRAGSVVVMDPRNGQVLAMASYPTYEPQEFVGGVGQDYWAYVTDEDNHYPFLNRAIQSAYPPGSTFKIVTASAALHANMVTPTSTLPCPPRWNFGKRNWNTVHEGQMDVEDALKRSCNTFFFELAYRSWLSEENQVDRGEDPDEVVQQMAHLFGMGATTGIDLPNERAGIIPTREWKRDRWERLRDDWCAEAEAAEPGTYYHRLMTENCEEGWKLRGGDAANLAIGQGDIATTPLQIATAYGAIANGGTIWQPHMGVAALGPDGEVVERFGRKKINDLPLATASVEEIQKGLEQVVMDATYPSGTASTPFQGFPLDEIPVAGKTGTAESGTGVPYAWFAAYAPADDPQYVVAATVEHGGGGSVTAAPIVRRVLEATFDLELSPFRLGPKTE